MTFETVTVTKEELVAAFANAQGEVMAKTFFDNGYGVSVIRHSGSYGNAAGLFELAVLKGTADKFELCYDTPITGDVLGYLTPEEVVDYTVAVSKL